MNCSFSVTAQETVDPNNCPNCILGTEVSIGTQVWSGCNLAVTTYSDNTPILEVRNPSEWISKTIGAWCHYNNDPANDAIYGKMYNWYAVMGIHDAASLNNPALRKSLAPPGFHTPTDAEWTTVVDYLNAESPTGTAGSKMKEVGTCHWNSDDEGATNSSGFTALPGGYYGYGGFNSMGDAGYWWSLSR